jgi:hypothetical protein
MVKKNVVPTPGLLSAQIFPPCCTTIAFTTANPTPEPIYAVGFACQNKSKIFETSVSLMPGPVSLIANRTWLSICTELRVTRPPSGVNLIVQWYFLTLTQSRNGDEICDQAIHSLRCTVDDLSKTLPTLVGQ